MKRPGKNERRKARERANTSAIDRLNASIRDQQKQRIRKPHQQALGVTTPAANSNRSEQSAFDIVCEAAARAAGHAAAVATAELVRHFQAVPPTEDHTGVTTTRCYHLLGMEAEQEKKEKKTAILRLTRPKSFGRQASPD
jgi:hypothetical protein